MNARVRQILARRKRRIQKRLDKNDLRGCAKPMLTASNIQYEIGERGRGIGYGGIAYAEGLKGVKIKKDDLAPPVEGNLETVQSGKYGLSRELYFYTFDSMSPDVQAFVTWVLGPDGQKVVTDVGYFPVKK